jgi:hypothetical protein
MVIQRVNVGITMKKTNTKLQLKTNTIRVLQNDDLTKVVGGSPTVNCTNLPTCGSGPAESRGCSHGHHC